MLIMTITTGDIKIENTTKNDRDDVIWLFEQAMEQQGKNGYRVWNEIDIPGLEKDIENQLQYKIVHNNHILCIFSIQYNDPFIWCEKDQDDAIYLHRIVVHPAFKGQKQFEKVLTWAKQHARQNNLKFVRMDTWAENKKIIEYYKSYGFECIGNFQTPDSQELPVQNRNLHVALLEMELDKK